MSEIGPSNSETGKRPQLPTARTLPKREEGIEHAWGKGLITAEEYESVVPSKQEE
jgi:hypothetical protein